MKYLAVTINQCIQLIYILPFLIIATVQYVKGGYGKLDYKFLTQIFLVLGFLFLENLGYAVPKLSILNNMQWNWQYKLWQIVIALIFIFLVFRKPRELGLRLPEKESQPVMWIVLMCVVVSTTAIALWDISRQGTLEIETRPLIETMLFQAFMPGLSEELIYRGIVLLGFAAIFFGPKIKLGEVLVGWEVPISMFLFILTHHTFVDSSTLAINFFAAVYVPIVGWIQPIMSTWLMTWIVLRTKSILPAIVMHSCMTAIWPFMTLVFGR